MTNVDGGIFEEMPLRPPMDIDNVIAEFEAQERHLATAMNFLGHPALTLTQAVTESRQSAQELQSELETGE